MGNPILIASPEQADALMAKVRDAADQAQRWIKGHAGGPMDLLRMIKFESVGRHPIDGYPLNFIEQINQTWTFAVAIAAARRLVTMHPEAGGMLLAPGAHASQDLDIMSVNPGIVGAETFAAVRPSNNDKLAHDLRKLDARNEQYRYVFFMSPGFPHTERRIDLEKHGVEVWSVRP